MHSLNLKGTEFRAHQGVCTQVTALRPRGGDKMCPVARLPTFLGSGPIRRPDHGEIPGDEG